MNIITKLFRKVETISTQQDSERVLDSEQTCLHIPPGHPKRANARNLRDRKLQNILQGETVPNSLHHKPIETTERLRSHGERHKSRSGQNENIRPRFRHLEPDRRVVPQLLLQGKKMGLKARFIISHK